MNQGGAPHITQVGEKQAKSKKAKPIPKLIKNDKGNKVYQGINTVYKLFYIVRMFTGKLLWWSSCVGLMYLLPINILLFKDQEMVLNRMAMQGSIPGMGPQ